MAALAHEKLFASFSSTSTSSRTDAHRSTLQRPHIRELLHRGCGVVSKTKPSRLSRQPEHRDAPWPRSCWPTRIIVSSCCLVLVLVLRLRTPIQTRPHHKRNVRKKEKLLPYRLPPPLKRTGEFDEGVANSKFRSRRWPYLPDRAQRRRREARGNRGTWKSEDRPQTTNQNSRALRCSTRSPPTARQRSSL